MTTSPRPHVSATFPASSQYADFTLRIERPIDEQGREVLDRGWDILYAKKDGSTHYNHWADSWDEVQLFFSAEPARFDVPPWVVVGKFREAIFPDDPDA